VGGRSCIRTDGGKQKAGSRGAAFLEKNSEKKGFKGSSRGKPKEEGNVEEELREAPSLETSLLGGDAFPWAGAEGS